MLEIRSVLSETESRRMGKGEEGGQKKNQALFSSWIIRINSKAFLPEKRVWDSSKSSGKSENRRNKGHTVFNFGFLKGHRVQGSGGGCHPDSLH